MEILGPLPEKIPYKFPKESNQKISELNKEEQSLISLNKEYIEKNSFKWKIDKNFKFQLPKSIFSSQEKKQMIDIPQNFQQKSNNTRYATNVKHGNKFNKEILEQIWYGGKFEIESNQEGLPYTWKLSNLTVKGFNNIVLRYFKDMALAFKFFYTIKNRFKFKNYFGSFPNSFLSCFYHLYMTIRLILNSLVGVPIFRDNTYELSQKIKQEDLIRFIKSNPNFNFNIYNHKNLTKLYQLETEFKNEWQSKILPVKLKYYKTQNLHKNQILQNIDKDEKNYFRKYLSESQKFEELKKEFPNLEQFLESQQIINNERFTVEEEYSKKYEKYRNELNKNSIKILCSDWKDEKIEQYKNEKNKEKEEKLNKIINQKIENNKDPHLIYNYNYNSEKDLPNKLNIRKEKEKIPMLKFRVSRLLAKPYEIVTTIGYNNNKYYSLNKYRYYYVKTEFYFWRIWLFLIKLFTNFWNYNYRVINQMTNSMFGIKALFQVELYRDLSIYPDSGIVYNSYKTYTYPRSVSNLISWVFDSRRKFESSPDTGILSKSTSRIFNLLLNYIIRLTIIGLLLIILYPILIVTNIVICLALILISPIIAPLWDILDYIYSIFLYNRYDSIRFFNIIRIILVEFMICTIIQFLFCLICLISQPILSLFFILYSHIHFIIRYIYDFIFYFILKYLGKIPLTDSYIAWRISGPHLFRERFYDISNKDLMNLVIAEVEKMVMNNYSNKIKEKLNEPKDNYNKMKSIFNIINLNISYNNDILNSISFYEDLLQKQIRKEDKSPSLSYNIKVKFSEERLDIVKNMVEAYLRDYCSKNDLSFELDKFEEKKYEQLTEKILKNIFGKDILQTLDDVDKIVHLESIFESNLDEISERIFENPKFDDRKYVNKKIEKEVKIKFPQIAYFKNVFEYNGKLNLNLNVLNEKQIKELIK